MLEMLLEKVDSVLVAHDKSEAKSHADSLHIGYYIPFSSNEAIENFLKKDPDFHRRRAGLREVHMFYLYLILISFIHFFLNDYT